jgi:glycosyltransferase involved in cell wall biosynthesis
LADAIAAVLGNKEFARRLSQSGKARVGAMFSMEHSISEVEALYAQLVDAPGQGLMEAAAQ